MSLEERARRTRLLTQNGAAAAACRRCAIGAERRNNVYGEGDPCARLMVVGEGPGETEDLTGRPFVGRAGQLLDKMLGAIDIGTIGLVPGGIQSALTALAGSDLLHYQIPWSGGISSGGGQLSAFVNAFPVALAQQLLQTGALTLEPSLTVKLTIQALGTTNNGSKMTSDPFSYPVSVCAGCLVENVASCPLATAPANRGNPCNPAQDDPIDCCLDSGTLICPPTVAGQ